MNEGFYFGFAKNITFLQLNIKINLFTKPKNQYVAIEFAKKTVG